MEKSIPRVTRIEFIDYIRGIAALLVMLEHCLESAFTYRFIEVPAINLGRRLFSK